ncbi:MAG: thioredoxin [Candidatus Cloacimonetes bacterium]|jgi:thioredoxin 1|nr:thioredoxin [Candidatus Cloacimonadota bacterium]MCK9335244.1 thioredoxin [Candidatus Cloacimonadota bacterium]MDD3096774.1 thioredoxin [Candidatus Cloacimonadota bacterium]MDY0336500.1 thioredoxin [Candidatus Cloacimonadaceae bacterium]HRX76148.1 thioredoxin [Candidatus Cloacimonadota bacterium]
MIIELTDKNFSETVASGKVIIDFWADWCGPCRVIAPIVEEIARERADIVFGKVNVDDYPELAGKHGVMSIPTLLFMKDGKVVDTSIGAVSKSAILNKLAAL